MASHISYTHTSPKRLTEKLPWALVFTVAALVAAAAIGIALAIVGLAKLRLVLAGIAALIGAAALFVYPGIAIAFFVFAGMIKGDPYVAAVAPFDLTMAFGASLLLACTIKLLRSDHLPFFPRAYALYVPIVLLVIGSVLYTPDMGAGVDKAERFLILTVLAIACPFILLDTPRKLRLFLYATACLGTFMSAESMAGLGGSERLTTPGGLTIQLGSSAGMGIAVVWSLILPRLSFRRRLLFYPVVGVLFIALIGSGARGAMIGAVCCVLFALLHFRQLWLDAGIFALGGIYGVARIGIPTAAFDYLGTLISNDPNDAMGTRSGLMALGWRLFKEHPLLGVGIGGYPYYSPDPITYGYPHNLFLEIAAELGFVALLAFTGLVLWAFWEAGRQVRDRKFPLWPESTAVLSLLIFGFLQMIKSGDMNDNRVMWLFMGLPFLLRHLAKKAPKQTQDTSPSPLLVQ